MSVRKIAPWSDPAEIETLLLRRIGRFQWRIDVAQRLRASGLGLKAAHTAISELAERDWTICEIPTDGGLAELAADLLPLDVQVLRARQVEEPAATKKLKRDGA